jgi:F0F1-type ATP synthase membrane subunit b/b'
MAAIKSKSRKSKKNSKAEQIKQIIDDAELREHALSALHQVQHAVEEARTTEQKISRRAEKKLRKAKKQAAGKTEAVKGELVDAAAAAKPKAKPAKKKRHPVRNLLVLATVGAIVTLVVSEDARKIVLDTLFGAEEEFQYTSTTTAGASTNGAS